ncbi:MAG: prepilin-type N-terminal cleavage/methylation domain-containing protein [Elusimicrobiaceae bacterium]|nr:prepilin-type N-terminal cleavage/methylation domain-containing protein [Elusimicrobiaceae bacterium]MBT4008187.1 prepilin-type N-terminal cleavage/methylation domain-containing protein [Elusimicrobiaceae bacterium]MBT4402513.1 prepilin-type N-terminal cleavage/methylation domain-containing protein [Elusimicrobiaceae bacterium]MBT4439640.1 prepilin-type N-terminal cleavage/methylation domain-containing protein [Elusimicrobiaceae bacterium]MBT5988066.1 prepilin-type N-terminal cleavage/methyl
MFKNLRNKKAFTLIELLAVVLIIGIFAAVAYPNYRVFKENASIAEALENIEQVRAKQEYFLTFNGSYTEDFNVLDLDISGSIDEPEVFETDNFSYELYSNYVTAIRLNSIGYKITLTSYTNPLVSCSCPVTSVTCTKVCNSFDSILSN